MAIAAGLLGYVMRRYGFPLITVAIGYILGPLVEKSFIQSLQISDGSYLIFVTQPIAAGLMSLTIFMLFLPFVAAWRRKLKSPVAPIAESTPEPRSLKGPFVWTVLLTLLVVTFLVTAISFPERVRIAPFLAGGATLALLLVLVAAEFIPRLRRWTEDTSGARPRDNQGGADRNIVPIEWAPWPIVLRFAAYIVGFFLFVFLLGFFVVPPVFIALFLINEARVGPKWAILSAMIASFSMYGGMVLLNVDIWTGAIPEIVPGLIGGAIIPPV
jgi:hypothetical protein